MRNSRMLNPYRVAEGMTIIRILDGLVKNRYPNNPGKLAAWHSASRIEKVQKKKGSAEKLGDNE